MSSMQRFLYNQLAVLWLIFMLASLAQHSAGQEAAAQAQKSVAQQEQISQTQKVQVAAPQVQQEQAQLVNTKTALNTKDAYGQQQQQTIKSGQNGATYGPPVRVANGLGQFMNGNQVGNSLQAGGALLGLDAKALEALGGANLLKGGVLMGSALKKTALAKVLGGMKGKKIASIIETPVKVVALGDIAAGSKLTALGQAKGAAGQTKSGQNQEGQVVQSTQQIEQQVEQPSLKAGISYGVKILPIILPGGKQQGQQLQQGQQQIEQQAVSTKGVQQQQITDSGAPNLLNAGNTLLGGLANLLPGLGNNQLGSGSGTPFNLFNSGRQNAGPGYAAVLNSNNPLAGIFTNPSLNPFLIPLNGLNGLGNGLNNGLGGLGALGGLGGGSFGQAPISGAPTGQTTSYNLLPGIKVRESFSVGPQQMAHTLNQQQQQLESAASKV